MVMIVSIPLTYIECDLADPDETLRAYRARVRPPRHAGRLRRALSAVLHV